MYVKEQRREELSRLNPPAANLSVVKKIAPGTIERISDPPLGRRGATG
jgi:hypothetical protein